MQNLFFMVHKDEDRVLQIPKPFLLDIVARQHLGSSQSRGLSAKFDVSLEAFTVTKIREP